MDEEDKIKAIKLSEEIQKLEKEWNKLAGQSYSQSDPGAVMDRRFVSRALDKKRREYDALLAKKN